MRPFVYIRANDRAAVAQSFAASGRQRPPTSAQAQFIAGGTTMLDPMKRDVM
jgi:CO/xanthine dehydrogenase FAD-binding subunit